MNDDELRAAFSDSNKLIDPEATRFLTNLERRLCAQWTDSDAISQSANTSTSAVPSWLTDRDDTPLSAAGTASAAIDDGLRDVPGVDLVGIASATRVRRRPRVTGGVAVLAVAALIGGVLFVKRDTTSQAVTLAMIGQGTTGAKTARIHLTYETASSSLRSNNRKITMTVDGAIDFTNNAGDIELTIAGAFGDGSGLVRNSTFASPARPKEWTVRIRWKGNDQWTQENMFGLGPNKDRWKYDNTSATKTRGTDGGAFVGFFGGNGGPGLDPAGILKLLESRGTLTELGTDTVRGDHTTKFRVTVARNVIDRASKSTKPVTFDLWSDETHRLRKIRADQHAMGDDWIATFEFYDFGINVDVRAPNKKDIVDSSRPRRVNVDPSKPVKLTGAWAESRNGNEHGITWALWKAPAENEQICWSIHTTAKARTSAGMPLPTTNGVGPEHGGDASVCEGAEQQLLGALGSVVLSDTVLGDASLFAIVGISATTATLTLANGTESAIAVADGSSVVVTNQTVTKIVAGSGQNATVCRPGTKATVAVTSPAPTSGSDPSIGQPNIAIEAGSCSPLSIDDQIQGAGPLSGPWVTIRRGQNAGISWTLSEAPARKD